MTRDICHVQIPKMTLGELKNLPVTENFSLFAFPVLETVVPKVFPLYSLCFYGEVLPKVK